MQIRAGRRAEADALAAAIMYRYIHTYTHPAIERRRMPWLQPHPRAWPPGLRAASMPSERAPSSTVCWWPSVCTGMGVILLYYCNSRYGHANGCHQLPCTSRRTRPPRHQRLEQHPAHTCPTLPSSFSRHRLFLEFVQNVTPCHQVPHRAVGFHGNARRGIAHDYCRTSSTVLPLMIAVLP